MPASDTSERARFQIDCSSLHSQVRTLARKNRISLKKLEFPIMSYEGMEMNAALKSRS